MYTDQSIHHNKSRKLLPTLFFYIFICITLYMCYYHALYELHILVKKNCHYILKLGHGGKYLSGFFSNLNTSPLILGPRSF